MLFIQILVIVTVAALSGGDAKAYEMGTAPFCAMNDRGDLECYYYTMSYCKDANKYREEWTCILNPNKR